jgi:DNA-binding LytR/AlgR family response regulator
MTFKIGLCDDDSHIFTYTKKIIKEVANEQQYVVEFDEYNNGVDVINRLLNKKESLDILILDIDMPTLSGFQLAGKLREGGEDLIIIFLTAHEQFVFAAYEYTPFRYIRKNCMEKELPLAINAALRVVSNKIRESVLLKTDDGEYRCLLSDIVYYEFTGRNNRRIEVILQNGEKIHTRKTITEMQNLITDEHFLLIHRSCVVNSKYIRNIGNGIIKLDNGNVLPLSRTRQKEIEKRFAILWSKSL